MPEPNPFYHQVLEKLSDRPESYESKLREMITILDTMLPDERDTFDRNSSQFSHADLLRVLRQQFVIGVLGGEK